MILNFKIQNQLLEHWCWSAVASSISFYFDGPRGWRQEQLASRMVNPACGIHPIPAGTCDHMMNLSDALRLTQNYSGEAMNPLPFGTVVNSINRGLPVGCQIIWPGVNSSHFVVIYGYNSNDLIIGDPQSGPCTVNYGVFINNYRGGQWARSIATRQAPLPV